MRAVLVGVAIVLGSGTSLSAAHAVCASPHAALFPADGPLPPRPILYRFDSPYDPPTTLRVDGPDGPVPFTARVIGATRDLRVVELRIEATSGTIVIGEQRDPALGFEPVVGTYEVGGTAVPAGPLVATARREQDRWSCSYTDGIALDLAAPGAAALAVRWSDGTEWLVAPSTGAFFGHPDGTPLLGHASCLGDQIPPAYIGRQDFTVSAIYPDGSRAPVVVVPPGVVSPPGAAADQAASSVPMVVIDEPAVPPLRTVGPDLRVLGGLALAAGGLVVVWLVRRRRRQLAVAS